MAVVVKITPNGSDNGLLKEVRAERGKTGSDVLVKLARVGSTAFAEDEVQLLVVVQVAPREDGKGGPWQIQRQLDQQAGIVVPIDAGNVLLIVRV